MPENHGWTHANDIDPIPGLALTSASANQWANVIVCPLRAATIATSNNVEANAGPTAVFDTNYQDNLYVKLGDANGDHLSFLVNLGPKGSRWKVQPVGAYGPNHAKLTFSLATAEEASDLGSAAANLGNIEDASQMTFVDIPNMSVDYYKAAFSPLEVTTTAAIIRIMGDEGDVGTAFTLSGDHYDWDGGPGMHRLKFVVSAGHAGAGGFEVRLHQLLMVRVDEFNQP